MAQRRSKFDHPGLLGNMSSLNLQRLIGSIVDPNRQISDIDRQIADYTLDEIGAKPA